MTAVGGGDEKSESRSGENFDRADAIEIVRSVDNLEHDDIFLILLALVGVDPPECADELWGLVGRLMDDLRDPC